MKAALIATLVAVSLTGCAGSCLDPLARLSDCPAWLPGGWHTVLFQYSVQLP